MDFQTQLSNNKPDLKGIELAFYRHYSLIEVLDIHNYAAVVPTVTPFEPADIVAICLVGSIRASDDTPINLAEAWQRAQEFLPYEYYDALHLGQIDDTLLNLEVLEGGKG